MTTILRFIRPIFSVILRVMALTRAASRVLEITRALVDGKESKTSFEKNMGLLRRSVSATTIATGHNTISLLDCRSVNARTEYL